MRCGGRMRGRGSKQRPRRQQSDHIMQNIDMELELLKQTKEMIEQQQLVLESKRMYDQEKNYMADKPRYYEHNMYDSPGPSSSNRNYGHLYEDPVEQQDYIPLRPNRKRPANDSWPRGSGAKRFSRRGSVVQSFGSRLGPKPAPNKPNKGGKDGKIVSTGPPPQDQNADEEFVLRPGAPIGPKIRGRLGLALGLIMKEMKENVSNYNTSMPIFHNVRYLSKLKAAIQDRLKSLIMNKVVTSGHQMYNMYRKSYPASEDTALVKNVKRDVTTRTASLQLLNEDVIAAPMNPANYIKKEMGKVIDAELREIFRKLEIMHNPKLSVTEKARRLAKESIVVEMVEETEQDTEEIKQWKREMHQKIRKKLPKILIKNVNLIIRLLRLDLVYINTWTRLMSQEPNTDGGVHKLEVGIDGETAFAPTYCAKVRGYPKLPAQIRQFLEPFKPMWVKKHKIVRSLLYVAFRDRAGLDQLLKKNGVDCGDCFLRITSRPVYREDKKVTKQMPQAAKKKRQNVAIKEKQKTEPNASSDSLNISSDLDNQITDLLTMIRKAEEQDIDELNTAMVVAEEAIKTEDLNETQSENDVPTGSTHGGDTSVEKKSNVEQTGSIASIDRELSDTATVQNDKEVEIANVEERRSGELTNANDEIQDKEKVEDVLSGDSDKTKVDTGTVDAEETK